uniref:Secreted protein n=1 Tax=Arundo donax TaxID=35708 RepID=A0A0A9CL72_ARUDO
MLMPLMCLYRSLIIARVSPVPPPTSTSTLMPSNTSGCSTSFLTTSNDCCAMARSNSMLPTVLTEVLVRRCPAVSLLERRVPAAVRHRLRYVMPSCIGNKNM